VSAYNLTIDDKGPPDEDVPHDPEGKGTLRSCAGVPERWGTASSHNGPPMLVHLLPRHNLHREQCEQSPYRG
jgi:hypothetical protein